MDANERLDFIREKLGRKGPVNTHQAPGLFKKVHLDQCPEPKKTGYVKVYRVPTKFSFGLLYAPEHRRTKWVGEGDEVADGLKTKHRHELHALNRIAEKLRRR